MKHFAQVSLMGLIIIFLGYVIQDVGDYTPSVPQGVGSISCNTMFYNLEYISFSISDDGLRYNIVLVNGMSAIAPVNNCIIKKGKV